MRWLRISYVLSRAGHPILLSATLLGGCGRTATVRGVDASPAGQDGQVREIVLALPSDGGADSVGGIAFDGKGVEPGGRVVATPASPTLATLPRECLDLGAFLDAGTALDKSRAARVTMRWAPSTDQASVGLVQVAPEIASLVIGLPFVEVTDKTPLAAPDPIIANLRKAEGGFAFDVSWSPTTPKKVCKGGQEPSWTWRTTLRLRCGSLERTIESFTAVALCGFEGDSWASSGDACSECAMVCEMAPSPLVPAQGDDGLPLGAALNVVVSPVLRAGHAMVLLARHAAMDGLDYAWQVSAGTVEPLDRDLVLWRLPDSNTAWPQLAQVAVTGADLAAVASFRCSG